MDNSDNKEANYIHVVRYIYDLIRGETDRYDDPSNLSELPTAYPKIVVMWQFFRLLRGEAFLGDPVMRPPVHPDQQKLFYTWENDIRQKLDELKQKLDPNDQLVQGYIKDTQKKFELQKPGQGS